MSTLQRYGIRWAGDREPVCTGMDDGYWTPWHTAEAELARLRAELAAVTAERDELVMAVASKFPGESRHATALRYIREREAQTPECAQEARDD